MAENPHFISRALGLEHPQKAEFAMKFIEMTGRTLAEIVKDDELHPTDLKAAQVDDQTIVRINEHGDIEVRRPVRWDVIGGLLGDYVDRVKEKTGLDWV